jgi:hypothetical protein
MSFNLSGMSVIYTDYETLCIIVYVSISWLMLFGRRIYILCWLC